MKIKSDNFDKKLKIKSRDTKKRNKIFSKRKEFDILNEDEEDVLQELDDLCTNGVCEDEQRVNIEDCAELKKPKKKIPTKEKVTIGIIIFLLCSIIGIVSSVRSIRLVDESPEIFVNDIVNFDYVVEPKSAQDREINVNVDSNYFQLLNDGTYRALKEGKTKLSLSYNDKIFNEYVLEIKEVFLKDLKFNPTSIDLGIGNTYSPELKIIPENTTHPKYTLSTDNEEIATIDNGTIVGIKEGQAIVTATSDNGIKAELEVNVVPVLADNIEIIAPKSLKISDTEQLEIKWNPENVTYKDAEWSVDDTSLASISNSGELKCIHDGLVTVTAKEKSNGKIAYVQIRILPIIISNISLSSPVETLYVGNGTKLNVKYEPDNATYKECTFTSSDESVLKVNEYGYVTAMAVGKATITAKTVNGHEDFVSLNVENRPVQAYAVGENSYGDGVGTDNSDGGNEMVWVTATGKCYHSISNCGSTKTSWQVSKQQAIDSGLRKCRRCYK